MLTSSTSQNIKDTATNQDNSFWKNIRNIISDVTKEYDKLWIKRNRGINSKFLLDFIFNIIVNGDKGYAITLGEMWNNYLLKDVTPPQDKIFSQSSVCAARQKLSENIFKDLNHKLILEFEKSGDSLFMDNHRIFAVDGSKLNLPKELEDKDYKVNNKGAYYPQGLLSCIYNLTTYIIHDFCLINKIDERSCAKEHLEILQENDIVIFDRGYFSYLLLNQCYEKKVHPIFRLQGNLGNKEIMEFIDSNNTDKVIEYNPSVTVKHEIKKRGIKIDCKPISMRLIKYKINDETYIIGTTLTDSNKYQPDLFKELYHKRWNIEELYKISKIITDLEIFHSKTERGVKQEIYAHFVLINISRFFESQASKKHQINTKKYKFNFKNSLATIKNNIQELLFAKLEVFLGKIPMILNSIARIKQKIRPDRKYLRVSYRPRNRWSVIRSVGCGA